MYIGQVRNQIEARLVKNMFEDLDIRNRRPFDQWWRELSPVQRIVSMKDSGKPAVEISIADADPE